MRILVAEDEKLLSDAICCLLQEAGYFTDAVFNGTDAVYYAKEISYQLIILDIMLPEIDGIEVLTNIRQNNVSTPILMLTAKSTIPDKVSALNAGADDYMTKPFHTDELIARVNALMRRTGNIVLNELTYGDLHLNLNSASLQCLKSHVTIRSVHKIGYRLEDEDAE